MQKQTLIYRLYRQLSLDVIAPLRYHINGRWLDFNNDDDAFAGCRDGIPNVEIIISKMINNVFIISDYYYS
jgi:hypothetical protein